MRVLCKSLHQLNINDAITSGKHNYHWQHGVVLMEELGFEGVTRRKTNLWFLVNFRVHLRADEREQAQPVSLPQQVLLAIGHVERRILQYLSGDEGSSSESQGLIQSAVCGEPEGNAIVLIKYLTVWLFRSWYF